MALFTKMLVLFVCLAFAFAVFGIGTPATSAFGKIQNATYNKTSNAGMIPTITNTLDNINGITAVAIVASVIFSGGSITAILFAATAIFFVSYFAFPSDLLGAAGFPPELSLLVTFFYLIMEILFAFSLISWLKGND